MADGPIDLIRFEGHGNSVVLRISGAEEVVSTRVLNGEFLVETPFVRGTLRATVVPADLWEWRDALDGLDAGHDIGWRENTRGASMIIERAGDQALVTIKDDDGGAATTVTVTVPLPDEWFDDAYERLDHILKTWPMDV